MRYLRVAVKDQSANALADTVELLFFLRTPKLPDERVRQATAVDVSADGRVDYQITGDIDGNGVSGEKDRELLKDFANAVLRVNWLCRPPMPNRSINFYVSRFTVAGDPAEVRLDLYQNDKPMIEKQRLKFSVTACDSLGKGVMQLDDEALPLELFDTMDLKALQSMANLYLKFNWR
ncbi:hypothetical protein [Pseudomonas sp. 22 E 5]|uniref:Uncharacterized protein n=1 Tax=Pseudomonas salomonii TaxID=191391 RepID=A0A1H3QMN5_9PSED|nr:hypothetical protein [Pseudomonas salomonii]NWF11265.1 hypothetical protein [Pseudomonas salomonii]CRM83248.1 hypothetical protein [Pseudomonas sp. 22 E 5]SDZ14812.1 hypothetical protein SAMN05216247_107235 [Pseudomonas salomonii]